MFKFLFTLILFLSIYFTSSLVQAQTISSCLNLQSDLGYGMTSTSITLLQEYLKSIGDLSATPTGYFGPSTLAAVKTFQINNNISFTGYVGPLTRSMINKKSCNSISPVIQTITQQPIQTTIQPSTLIVTPTISSNDITNPAVGQVLSIGKTITIHWNKTILSNYNIVLEQPGGAGAGFIAQNISSSNANQYTWKVGKVFSTQINLNKTVDTGTYRIKLVDVNSGMTLDNETSGWFTIIPSQFTVTSIVPTSAPADNATVVVLFGSGFTDYNNSIYFDTNLSGIKANNSYVSPDGTVLVFTIPNTVSSGSHTLYVNNGSNSTPITINFSVNSVQ